MNRALVRLTSSTRPNRALAVSSVAEQRHPGAEGDRPQAVGGVLLEDVVQGFAQRGVGHGGLLCQERQPDGRRGRRRMLERPSQDRQGGIDLLSRRVVALDQLEDRLGGARVGAGPCPRDLDAALVGPVAISLDRTHPADPRHDLVGVEEDGAVGIDQHARTLAGLIVDLDQVGVGQVKGRVDRDGPVEPAKGARGIGPDRVGRQVWDAARAVEVGVSQAVPRLGDDRVAPGDQVVVGGDRGCKLASGGPVSPALWR